MSHYHLLKVSEVHVTVVRFVDREILGVENINELSEELNLLLETATCKNLLLSFADVKLFSSSVLAELLKLDNRVKAAGGKLKLCNLRPEIREVFAITKFDRRFDIRADEGEALAAF